MAIGMERLMMLLEDTVETEPTDLFVAALGREAREEVIPWIMELRNEGFIVQMSYEDKGLKAQLKQADRLRSRYVLIVGEDELDQEELKLRRMTDGHQEEIPIDEVVSRIAEIISKESEDE